MALRENHDIADMISGALDWWRDAGVDCAFVDEPAQWLQLQEKVEQTAPQVSAARPKPAAPIEHVPDPVMRLDRSLLPTSLEAFGAWWLSEASLIEGPLSARVPPRGPQGADLMVVVPEPEQEDGDTLLSGPQGRLLDAMLAAFGIASERTYFSSALPRHLPGADWQEIAARGLGDVLTQHVALVRPKRLAVFGTSVLPLIGNGPPQAPADLRIFNHEDMKVGLLACRSLAALLEQPRWKARIWQAWLELSGTDSSG